MSALDAFLLVLVIGMVGSLIGAYFNHGEIRRMLVRVFLACLVLMTLTFVGYLLTIFANYNSVIDRTGSGTF